MFICVCFINAQFTAEIIRGGGGGGSTGVGNSNFLVTKFIGADLAHFKSD